MTPVAGTLLVATPVIADPNFERSVVLVVSHDDEDGTLGVVIDRPTTIPVSEYLPEWEPVVASPPVVFHGGPVDPTVGLAITMADGRVDMVELSAGPVDDRPVRIFAGYAGWGPGQLDAELAEQAWFVVGARPGDLTTPHPDDLWSTVLRRQNSEMAFFATYPSEPSLN